MPPAIAKIKPVTKRLANFQSERPKCYLGTDPIRLQFVDVVSRKRGNVSFGHWIGRPLSLEKYKVPRLPRLCFLSQITV